MVVPDCHQQYPGCYSEKAPTVTQPNKPVFKILVLANNDFKSTMFARQIRQLSSRDHHRPESNKMSRTLSLHTVKRIFSFFDKNYRKLSRSSSYIANLDSDSIRSSAQNNVSDESEYSLRFKGNSYRFTHCTKDINNNNIPEEVLDRWSKEGEPGKRFVLYVVPLSEMVDQNQESPEIIFKQLLNNEKLQDASFVLFLIDDEVDRKKLVQESENFDDSKVDLKRRKAISKNDPKYAKYNSKKELMKRFHTAMGETARRDEPLYCRYTNATDKGCMKAINDIAKMNLLNDLLENSFALTA